MVGSPIGSTKNNHINYSTPDTTMLLRDKIKDEPGFQYVVDNLQIMSSAARRQLLDTPWQTDGASIEREYDNIARVADLLRDPEAQRPMAVIRHKLMELHDIATTLGNLIHHMRMTEVELFEIKQLSLLCIEADKAARQLHIESMLAIPSLQLVFDLLDPDHTGIANFYIYDSYHPQLGPLRRELKQQQAYLDAHEREMTEDQIARQNALVGDLFGRQEALQQQIVAQLSDRLQPMGQLLLDALGRMAYTDILIAKAEQSIDWQLCRPEISRQGTAYEGLFNARLRSRNGELGIRYQPIDIRLQQGVCLITGANMAGKTVVLKTVGVAQLMVQFGMYAPAARASVQLVDDVVFCIGDEQNEMNGLSSFASEIIKISSTLRYAERAHLLVLIDEPARTTNPIEGKAIVQAIGSILDSRPSLTLITTHYSYLGLGCRRLRVKGFDESLSHQSLSADTINQFMDYALVEEQSEEVPHEALRIATILGCDSQMLDEAQRFLDANNS